MTAEFWSAGTAVKNAERLKNWLSNGLSLRNEATKVGPLFNSPMCHQTHLWHISVNNWELYLWHKQHSPKMCQNQPCFLDTFIIVSSDNVRFIWLMPICPVFLLFMWMCDLYSLALLSKLTCLLLTISTSIVNEIMNSILSLLSGRCAMHFS